MRRRVNLRILWLNYKLWPWRWLRQTRFGTWFESNVVVEAYQRWGLEPPYIEKRDWWVGYYRGDRHHYVCLMPTVVIRWRRHG